MLVKHYKFSNYLNTFYFFSKKNKIIKNKLISEIKKLNIIFSKNQLKKNILLKHFKNILNPFFLSNFTMLPNLFFSNCIKLLKNFKAKKSFLFLNLKFKNNNIILTLTNDDNKLICNVSMGILKIKTKRKKFDFFSMVLLGTDLANKFLKKKTFSKNQLNFITGVHVKFETLLKNYKFFYSIIHSFIKKTKLRIYSFTEKFKNAHNGVKLKRAKRI